MTRKNVKHVEYFLEYPNFKEDLIEYKCLCCKTNYQHKFDEKLKEQFFNTCRFSNHNDNVYFIVAKRCLSL